MSKRKHKMRRARRSLKVMKGRYGVSVSYEIPRRMDVGLAMRAIDDFLQAQIRRAVPRVGNQRPDSGMLMTGDPLVRDLQYDWSVVKDCFTKGEARKIAAVVERAGADAKVSPCRA